MVQLVLVSLALRDFYRHVVLHGRSLTYGGPSRSTGRFSGGGHHRVEWLDDRRHSEDRTVPAPHDDARPPRRPAPRRRRHVPGRRLQRRGDLRLRRRRGRRGEPARAGRRHPRPRLPLRGRAGPRPRRPHRRTSPRSWPPPPWVPAPRRTSWTSPTAPCCWTGTARRPPHRRPRRSCSPPSPRYHPRALRHHRDDGRRRFRAGRGRPRGRGDPTLSRTAPSQTYPGAPTVADLATQVMAAMPAGTPVTRVVVDSSLFTGELTAPAGDRPTPPPATPPR